MLRFLIICTGIVIVSGEIFSSVVDIEMLRHTGRQTLDVLQSHQSVEKYKLQSAKDRLCEHHVKTQTAGMIKALVRLLKSREVAAHLIFMYQNRKQQYSNDSFLFMEIFILPDLSALRAIPRPADTGDLAGIAEAFERIQTTYLIHPKDIAGGNIRGLRPSPMFNSKESYIIGFHHAQQEYFTSAIEWLQIANATYSAEVIKTGNISLIWDCLQFSWWQEKNPVKALQVLGIMKNNFPSYPDVESKMNMYQLSVDRLDIASRQEMEKASNEFLFYGDEYQALCRGDEDYVIMSRSTRLSLRCYYEDYNNPFLLLQPVKTELVHKKPNIFIFHDILRDRLLDQLKNDSLQNFERALSLARVNDTTYVREIWTGRISKWAIISSESMRNELTLRVGQATNLDASQPEPLRTQVYGIGGHFLPHVDYFNTSLPYPLEGEMGNRMASMVVYLSSTEAGGATVFLDLNVTVFPEKGSAVFWYNIHSDGSPDPLTWHAGCPVLSGIKWISTKHFYERRQLRTRPCSLIQDGYRASYDEQSAWL